MLHWGSESLGTRLVAAMVVMTVVMTVMMTVMMTVVVQVVDLARTRVEYPSFPLRSGV